MMAAEGQPIVAPFDGIAESGHNWLGGNAVYVRGENGYVYNAHLSAYGKLGEVQAGDVIGYVGSTGDAGGPHDHFEWHPGNGGAVDAYQYLMAVC
jgi:murein DD-endopeptidase MepM/ murein hydrolase activator NlpD